MPWKTVVDAIQDRYSLLHDVIGGGLSYGTAGFRTKGYLLPPVAARLIVIAALRGYSQKLKAGNPSTTYNIGFMITASHNPHEDNGFKIIDFNGSSIPVNWEPWCTKAVNTVSGASFASVIQECCQKEFNTSIENVCFDNIHVFIGTDTRKSGESIASAVVDILNILNVANTTFYNVSTPQLHEVVVQGNAKGTKDITPDVFEKKLLINFEKLMTIFTAQDKKHPKISLVVDASNGVGSLVLKNLIKMSETLSECHDVLNTFFNITILNDNVDRAEGLNHGCGADFVNRHREPSEKMALFGQSVPKEEDVHFYCLDGDADRLVALDFSNDNQWTLMDGDRIAILYSFLLHRVFGPELIAKMDIGIVQTAYANGASTFFVQDTLHMKTYLAATGVKNIHPVAEARDVGVYFEANGHGTILFNKAKIQTLLAASGPSAAERERLWITIQHMSELVSQVCGDALGDMLLCEVALRALNLSFKDLRLLYTDRPALQIKVDVPYPKRIQTTPDETRATAPIGFQEEIDTLIQKMLNQLKHTDHPYARSFARPSGTEAIVRVYSETNTEDSCKQLNEQVCDVVRRYCS